MIVIAFLIVLVPYSWTFKLGFTRIYDSEEAMRSLSEEVENKIQEEDQFLVYYTTRTPFEFYFSEYADHAVFQPWSQRGNQKEIVRFVTAHIEQAGSRLWFVFSHFDKTEEGWMVAAAKEGCFLIDTFEKPGCRAYLFECRER